MLKRGSVIQARTKKANRNYVLRFLLFSFASMIICYPFFVLRFTKTSDTTSENDIHSIGSFHNSQVLGTTRRTKRFTETMCSDMLTLRQKEDFYDPNKVLTESPKRLTVTEPPFWISLFIEWYDKMRWAAIYIRGNYYEIGLTNIFKIILMEENTSPGRIIDVGMNIGWYTLWSRSFGHTVASFEPNPVMHVRVCESLTLNGWDKDNSVQLFPYGVGNEEAEMALTTGNNPGGSSFFAERLAAKNRKEIHVKVVRLDDVAEQEGWLSEKALNIHLMKIDVEGFEYFTLLGAQKILSSGKVANIIMENSSTNGAHVLSLFHLIYNSGYEVHALLSVNGDPYHNDEQTLRSVNEAIRTITPSMDPKDFSQSWLITVTNNIWWKKRRIEV